MEKQTTVTKGATPREKFYIYDVEVEEKGQKIREIQVSLQKKKENDKCKFITACPFHPVALNDTLKNKNISFGERFYWVHKFFKYSLEFFKSSIED